MENFSSYLKSINNCDAGDPLLSETELGAQLDKIPLSHINAANLFDLTQALNLEQLIPNEKGLARDYRGLAELMGFRSIEIETRFKRSYNPTKHLIETFIHQNQATVNDLLKLLETIGRYDIIDDFLPFLVQLANEHAQSSIASRALKPLTTKSRDSSASPKLAERLTIDDRPYDNQITYDAFICYAPEDLRYVRDLSAFLEQNGKRVATSDDLLPGQCELAALAQLVSSRCRKVIIILTPNWLNLSSDDLQNKYASEIAYRAGSEKIIPVIYEACDNSTLPPIIGLLSKIDMTQQTKAPQLRWPLDKLLRSLDFDSKRTSQASKAGAPVSIPRGPASVSRPPIITAQDESKASSSTDNSGQNLPLREPIVELHHSQSSSSFGLLDEITGRQSPIQQVSARTSFLKFFKQKVSRYNSSSESQLKLLGATTPELPGRDDD